MAYEPLHHKYRPQTFADLVGQDAIATTLTNAIRSQRIAPAYLFTGPRGTGKTSSARILAKSLNCLNSPEPTAEPCGTCEVCDTITRGDSLDVIEIDAASNTGVDSIRELIERAQFVPVQCRFKIYCLDEVHMLSTAAFNALLKTLEEPPQQVVFVLATTDPQRVLPTIISRCQRFDFRRIPLTAMVPHLTYITDQEQIQITSDAVELVAQIAQGGLRDAESLLDQLSLLPDTITVEQVWDLVGSVAEKDLIKLLQAIAAQNPELILDCTRHLMDRGREPLVILQNLASFYRDILIAKTAPQRRDLVAITEPTWEHLCELAHQLDLDTILKSQQHLRTCEIQVKNTTQPRLWLEVSLLGLLPTAMEGKVSPESSGSPPPVPPPIPKPAEATTKTFQANPELSTPPAASPNGLPKEPQPQQTPARSSQANPAESRPTESSPIASSLPHSDTPLVPSISPKAVPSTVPEPTQKQAPVPLPDSDLTQVWQQLLENLSLPSRALMKEHGTLLSWQDQSVQIGIPKNLIKIAQGRLPEIEETFKKLFQRKIGVTLQIRESSSSRKDAPKPESTVTQTHQPTLSTAPPTSPPLENGTPPHPAATIRTADPSTPIPRAPGQDNASPTHTISPSPQQAKTQDPVASPAPPNPSWDIDNSVTQAVKSFAQFFNGAIVESDDDSPLALHETSEEPQPPEPTQVQPPPPPSGNSTKEIEDPSIPF